MLFTLSVDKYSIASEIRSRLTSASAAYMLAKYLESNRIRNNPLLHLVYSVLAYYHLIAYKAA